MCNSLKLAEAALIACLPLAPLSAQCVDAPCPRFGPGGPNSGTGISVPEANSRSFTGGLFSGYDQRVAPRVVLGTELGADGDDRPLPIGSPRADRGPIDPRWSLGLTARAGYLLEPNMLAYVRGGYSDSRAQGLANDPQARLPYHESGDVWTLGAGIERQFLHKISARLEYRYSELPQGADGSDRHRALAGIVYRF